VLPDIRSHELLSTLSRKAEERERGRPEGRSLALRIEEELAGLALLHRGAGLFCSVGRAGVLAF
jgi:hypothetical protein